jgi:hypothetical protein
MNMAATIIMGPLLVITTMGLLLVGVRTKMNMIIRVQ